MRTKEFKRMKQSDFDKIRKRFENKKQEFELLSLDELKEMYLNKKMSSTDKHALLIVTNEKLQAQESIKVIEDLDGE